MGSGQLISYHKRIENASFHAHLMRMNFPVNGEKATQAAARLIEQSGGPIDYLRLIKLIYLADRESIKERGIPIVGGHYFSMRKGPAVGEVMDFVNSRTAPNWKGSISARHGNEVRLENYPGTDDLSQSETDILDATVAEHRHRTTDELVGWCHDNCPEYEHVSPQGRKPITVEAILKAVGKSQKKIASIVREAEAIERLEALLS